MLHHPVLLLTRRFLAATLLLGAPLAALLADPAPALARLEARQGLTPQELALDQSPSVGPQDAPVTIVAFVNHGITGDGQELVLTELLKLHPGQGRIILKPIHMDDVDDPTGRSTAAAYAVHAAHNQQRGWDMHTLIMRRLANVLEAKNPTTQLEEYARFLGLDMKQFQKDMKNGAAALQRDELLRQRLNVPHSGALFVNGTHISGSILAALEAAGREAQQLIASGLSADTLHDTHFLGRYAPIVTAQPSHVPPDITRAVMATVEQDDPYVGKIDAPVTLVVFSDFQCPFCKRFDSTLKQLLARRPDDVRIVFKHHPLPFHKEAEPAARAAIAAHQQGQFWEYHDLLFLNMERLREPEIFIELASSLGLDLARFERDMNSRATQDKLRRDLDLAKMIGVRGTPATFINGAMASGARPLDDLNAYVQSQLDIARELQEKNKTLKGEALYKAAVAHNIALYPDTKTASTPPPEERLSPEAYKTLQRYKGALITHGNPKRAKVILYEFTDLQCPFCQRSHTTMQALKKRHGDDIAILSFHHPLSFHNEAEPAARAVYAAQRQGEGKGARMQSLIFQNQRALKGSEIDRLLLDYATQLDLDIPRFQRDYTSTEAAQEVAAQIKLSASLGVRSTPHYFVQDKRLVGAQPEEVFHKAITGAKADAKATKKKK